MKKILEQASRALAIMGIALIVWAGMGAQTAKAQVTTIEIKDGWLDPCVFHPLNGLCSIGNICPAWTFCKRGNAQDPIVPRPSPTGPTCCW